MITQVILQHLATDGTENGLTAAEKINKAIDEINKQNAEFITNTILTDGSVEMVAGFNPTSDQQVATKKYSDATLKAHTDAEYVYYTNLSEINLTDAAIQTGDPLEMFKTVVGAMRDHSILITLQTQLNQTCYQ